MVLENRICPSWRDCEDALTCSHGKKHKAENGCAVHCKDGKKCTILY